jgi:hypothetical protein
MASPWERRISTPGSRPQAMTVDAPDPAARFAARILVIMPPPTDAGTCTAGHDFEGRVAGTGFMNKRSRGIPARVSGVQPLLIGQDDQRIRFNQVRHQGAQGVVVPELDFVVDNGVVLVDDRQHPQFQKRQQGRARIQVALAIRQVGVGQQNLGTSHPVFTQLGFVHLRQAHLTHGRRSLQFMDFTGPRVPTEPLHAFGDCAARNHHHLATITRKRGKLATPFPDRYFIESAPFIGHET